MDRVILKQARRQLAFVKHDLDVVYLQVRAGPSSISHIRQSSGFGLYTCGLWGMWKPHHQALVRPTLASRHYKVFWKSRPGTINDGVLTDPVEIG